MFSTRLGRVAQRAPGAATANSSSTAAAHRTTTCLATHRSHQRRQSSSKASCPPDSSPSNGKPAPTTKAANTATEQKSNIADGVLPNKGSSKRGGQTRRSTRLPVGVKAKDQFAGLPAVAGTQHISDQDLSISSFFALHRPLAVGTAIPPSSSVASFDKIFQTRKLKDPWENGNSSEGRPEDVVYALGSLFENLDTGAGEVQDEGMRWEVLQESPSNHEGVRHLDGPPRLRSLDEQIASFRPFTPPPPPQPFPNEKKALEKRKASKPRRSSYETRIVFTQIVASNGETTYTTEATPIVRIPSPGDPVSVQEPMQEEEGQARWPFRERQIGRQRAWEMKLRDRMRDMTVPERKKLKMMLISVKRQRKLKMKKHKYKKLMKRTRNLRRRQDRA